MDLRGRLGELARLEPAASPVVSVYLMTRWDDEHQRERVRLFLKNEVQKARPSAGPALAADLDWIETQATALIEQRRVPGAQGVALFACQALGLKDVLPVRVAFEDTFIVGERPYVRPLAAVLEATRPALVVFVDTESARVIALEPDGTVDETRLESDVPGHHRRGGWALLAQSRYQRHTQDHRGRHFDAVADALAALVETEGVDHILLAGEPRTLAAFREHLPGPIAARVVGSVSGARHEAERVIADRAADLLARRVREEQTAAVEAVLTAAAKGERAVAGLDETLDAAHRGAVHKLFLLRSFRESGRACRACGLLQPGPDQTCRLCGQVTTPVELGEALVDRVLAGGGHVELTEAHKGLARVGGLAARLRYTP